MSTFTLTLTCMQCGNDVEHINAGTGAGTHLAVVCECTNPACARQWEVYVTMRHHAKDPDAAEAMRRANAKRPPRTRKQAA